VDTNPPYDALISNRIDVHAVYESRQVLKSAQSDLFVDRLAQNDEPMGIGEATSRPSSSSQRAGSKR
jgi:hypothetical protein